MDFCFFEINWITKNSKFNDYTKVIMNVTKSRWRKRFGIACLLLLLAMVASVTFLCLRVVWSTRIDLATYDRLTDAEQYMVLPFSGDNFETNSILGYGLGRYYLKGKTAATVMAAYAVLASENPQWRFVYGEMGWNGGGRFRPHRTHQQGMSADFITPVYRFNSRGEKDRAVLPVNIANLWGYNIRVSDEGCFNDYYFDTEAVIAHIAALRDAGKVHGIGITQVILDPPLLALLKKDSTFWRIADVKFMNGRAWFPHDGHYHVDFYNI